MPIYNVTIDDISPLVSYTGTWGDSSHRDDQFANYLNSTFHATESKGDVASFTFTGTGVYLFGARRINHDTFTVTIDGKPFFGNSFGDPFVFQTPLFGKGDLDYGEHHVELKNTVSNPAAPFLDLDFAVITTGDNDQSTISTDLEFEDDDPDITYSGQWIAINSRATQQTLHRTSQEGATASIKFEGNSIALYGNTDTDHGAFAIAIDGGESINLSATAPESRQGTLLYRFDGLKGGSHVVTLTNSGSTALDLDRFVVSLYSPSSAPVTSTYAPPPFIIAGTSTGAAAPTRVLALPSSSTDIVPTSVRTTATSTGAAGASSSQTPLQRRGLGTAALTGAVFAGVVCFLGLGVAIWWILRRRRAVAREHANVLNEDFMSPYRPPGAPGMTSVAGARSPSTPGSAYGRPVDITTYPTNARPVPSSPLSGGSVNITGYPTSSGMIPSSPQSGYSNSPVDITSYPSNARTVPSSPQSGYSNSPVDITSYPSNARAMPSSPQSGHSSPVQSTTYPKKSRPLPSPSIRKSTQSSLVDLSAYTGSIYRSGSTSTTATTRTGYNPSLLSPQRSYRGIQETFAPPMPTSPYSPSQPGTPYRLPPRYDDSFAPPTPRSTAPGNRF